MSTITVLTVIYFIISFLAIYTAHAPPTNSSIEIVIGVNENDKSDNQIRLVETYSPLTNSQSFQQISGKFNLIKSTNWQEWSMWTECKNEEHTRFRSCAQSQNIDSNDNVTIDNPLSTPCEVEKVETERQFCFTPKKNKNKEQKSTNSNPFMIEEEIIANYLKRPKNNLESIRVMEILRD
ncbi:hypothetical protein ACH3XW_35075 [Acanthocheilonema viteae]